MLASGLPSTSGLMGRNLMDHAYLLSWALMPRGLRHDARHQLHRRHRRRCAAARSAGTRPPSASTSTTTAGAGPSARPISDLIELVDAQNKFGADLRQSLIDRVRASCSSPS